MATAQTLEGKKRDILSKGYLNQMRRKEWVPGIVYGNGNKGVPILLGNRQLLRTFNRYGSRGLFSLQVEGEQKPFMVLIREIQKNPVNGDVIHIDFLEVKMDEEISSSVPVIIQGEEEIENTGGILQIGAKEIEISCLPRDIPEYFTCDVAGLNIGDKITVGDIALLPGVKMVSDLDTVLATVVAPNKAVQDEDVTEENEENAEEEPEGATEE